MADTVTYATRLSSDDSLEAMLRMHRQEGIANCQRFWDKSKRLKKFAARQQWPGADNKDQKQSGTTRRSPRLTIPETSRILATFTGRQMMERFERQYVPRNQSAARYAETMSKVDKAVMQLCDGEQIDSAAFKDGPGIQGISWVRWFIDEWSAEDPQLRFIDVPIWSMLWPATRELNLRDRAWHRWGSWWAQQAVRDRWSDKYDQITTLIGARTFGAKDATQPGQSSRIPWAGQAGNKPLAMSEYYDPGQRCLWIEYEEWKEYVLRWALVRPTDATMSYADAIAVKLDPQQLQAGAAADPLERVELSAKQLSEFKKAHFAATGEEVPSEMYVRKPRILYKYAYICGDVVLESGDLDVGCFTLTAMAAERVEHPDTTDYISLLEDLEDAQRMVNYVMSALVRDIQINPKGVLFVEQGLFRDQNEALEAFTSPGGVIQIPRGKISQGGKPYDWVAGGTSGYSNKLETMLSFYREALPRLAGFNPAALGQLGSDIRRVSGQVVRQLTDAAMTSNAERVDSFRLYRRECGRIFLAHARQLWDVEDLITFIGEEDAYDYVYDEQTGEQAIDPTTGQPQRILVVPPKEMWTPDAWKEIAIEEVTPTDDETSALWDTLQTQVQLLLQPMADTGKALFTSEDLVDLLPKIPATRRSRMRMRVQRDIKQMKMQKAQEMMAQQQAASGDESQVGGDGDGAGDMAEQAA